MVACQRRTTCPDIPKAFRTDLRGEDQAQDGPSLNSGGEAKGENVMSFDYGTKSRFKIASGLATGFIITVCLLIVALVGVVGYVAFHFISRFLRALPGEMRLRCDDANIRIGL